MSHIINLTIKKDVCSLPAGRQVPLSYRGIKIAFSSNEAIIAKGASLARVANLVLVKDCPRLSFQLLIVI